LVEHDTVGGSDQANSDVNEDKQQDFELREKSSWAALTRLSMPIVQTRPRSPKKYEETEFRVTGVVEKPDAAKDKSTWTVPLKPKTDNSSAHLRSVSKP